MNEGDTPWSMGVATSGASAARGVRIHCLCLVRDEADILPHTLDAALNWAHRIYALDNGSTDGTWELLQRYATLDSRVVPVARDEGPYRTSLWARIANGFLREARRGDWWCRLDADEIYVDDPREVLAGVERRDQVVFSISIQYYFTEVDVARYERDPGAYVVNWSPDRLRYYLANWSEPRFVRHIPPFRWRTEWPPGFWHMRPSMHRVRLRHYQYRSPPQIERRVRSRVTRTQPGRFMHEKLEDWVPVGLRKEDLAFPHPESANAGIWRTRVVRAAALHEDLGDGRFQIDTAQLPPLWLRSSLARRTLDRLRWWRYIWPSDTHDAG